MRYVADDNNLNLHFSMRTDEPRTQLQHERRRRNQNLILPASAGCEK